MRALRRGSPFSAQAGDAFGGGGVGAEQVGEVHLAPAERVDDVGLGVGGIDVHGDLLGRHLELLQGAGEGLAGAEQFGAGPVDRANARSGRRAIRAGSEGSCRAAARPSRLATATTS